MPTECLLFKIRIICIYLCIYNLLVFFKLKRKYMNKSMI